MGEHTVPRSGSTGLRVRAVGRLAGDVVAMSIRSGRWWLPIAAILLVVAIVLAFTAHVVVPSTVYTLF